MNKEDLKTIAHTAERIAQERDALGSIVDRTKDEDILGVQLALTISRQDLIKYLQQHGVRWYWSDNNADMDAGGTGFLLAEYEGERFDLTDLEPAE